MNARTMSLGLLLCLSTRAAYAQTTDDVQILVSGFALAASGAEKNVGVSLRTWPTRTGKTTAGVFSMFGCGNFSVRSAPGQFQDDAAAGWRVEITPTRIVNHAVTFRLRWIRALDPGKGLTPASEDVELTLKPGESRPMDTVPVVPTAAMTVDGRACGVKAASLRVSAEFPEWDNRLVGADIWLVERLANGTERSQLQSVRGLLHLPIPFYFDRIADVDLFGHLLAEPETGTLEISLEIVRAQVNVPPPADTHGYQAARWDRSSLHVKPDEVVEIPLPQLQERFGPYAKGTFALRIKARQIR